MLSASYMRNAVLARARGTSYDPVSVSLCVCLSQVGVLSKRLEGSGWFLAWRLPSTYHTVCRNEIQVSTKIRVLPSGTLSYTMDLKNFATTSRSTTRVINLARQRWRSERDKLDRRRSTVTRDGRLLVYHSDRQALSTARFLRAGLIATAGDCLKLLPRHQKRPVKFSVNNL